ncbi:polyhydroxyalkanoic acid synthase subunit PhaR [Aneurinibacillus sp. Ricciae_BoGa-3]|uniref:polyhydroxyalkanoic acid synthase subunit PhaR n=1 Tax=Aneurinibacillus sp. Ricciae_BoGa-3 TaxID=3022697 RepID=UPI002340D40C|nr:polyhydroxyalkanoic acid synthase subunit PhaR [Aneurinibacillus sp. Ricciae_BoGa-3]WCK55814.1 polyhydroxyalkanoic acid synthase subunit PhaR [Aneurinibacillus sp. Ricciae_BoGa-3]
MNQQIPFDPFAVWKDMYDKTESHWSKSIDETMRREDFSQWMGQFLNMYLQYQNMVRQSTDKILEQVNMPSRADISNLSALIVNLEAKVEGLEELVEGDLSHQINNLDTTREVNRLKIDIKSLDKKMDQVLKLLKQQEEMVSSLKETAAAKETEATNESETPRNNPENTTKKTDPIS